MTQQLTLLELNKSIQETLKNSFPKSIWVIAEIGELKVNRNGHCYLELIEKDAITDNIIARSRATIWAFTFRILRPYFENMTNRELSAGLKVLVNVNIEFHELYGLSLNITDIDPNYTLGDIAQKKANILKKLEEEGVINMNKELDFPVIPQKIAIISSETAAGYQDFMDQLEKNTFAYKFYTKLFPSVMQGLEAEESIIKSLEIIYNYEEFFDVVVIIRGGGSQSDLSCFDNYLLAANVAQYPIPILTGIGHDKDESIVDIVAHKKLKTPTAVAEYLVDKVLDFDSNLMELRDKFIGNITQYIQEQEDKLNRYRTFINSELINNLEKQRYILDHILGKLSSNFKQFTNYKDNDLKRFSDKLENKSSVLLSRHKSNIDSKKTKLKHNVSLFLKSHQFRINNQENKHLLLDPINILKRGYSITYLENKKLTNISKLKKNDVIITKLFDGFIRSTVKGKSKNKPS